MNIRQLADLADLRTAARAELDFMDRAACAGEDHQQFFPAPGRQIHPVWPICGRCPVTRQCADYAIAGHIHFGTFGGLSERQRKLLREAHQTPGVCDQCGRPTPLNRTVCNNCA